MQPVYQRLVAAGAGPWVPVDRRQTPFNLAVAGSIDAASTLTWKVQHTLSRLNNDAERQVSISRTTTVATVTDPAHGLKVGDSPIIMGSGSSNLDGEREVASVVDANTYTYTVANSGATASNAGTRAKNLRVFDHATLTGQTGSADGNYAFPPTAIRFYITAFTSGALNGEIVEGK